MSSPMAAVTEREVIKPATYDHLRDYIFSSNFLEPLKATEHATKRGHCFAIRQRTLPQYRKDAKEKGITPVSEKVYRRVLSSKVTLTRAHIHTHSHIHTHTHTHPLKHPHQPHIHFEGVHQLPQGPHDVQNVSPVRVERHLGQGEETPQSPTGAVMLGHDRTK